MGGKARNKHRSNKLKASRGLFAKTPLVGVNDHETNLVATKPMASVTWELVGEPVDRTVATDAPIYSDVRKVYGKLPNN